MFGVLGIYSESTGVVLCYLLLYGAKKFGSCKGIFLPETGTRLLWGVVWEKQGDCIVITGTIEENGVCQQEAQETKNKYGVGY